MLATYKIGGSGKFVTSKTGLWSSAVNLLKKTGFDFDVSLGYPWKSTTIRHW